MEDIRAGLAEMEQAYAQLDSAVESFALKLGLQSRSTNAKEDDEKSATNSTALKSSALTHSPSLASSSAPKTGFTSRIVLT